MKLTQRATEHIGVLLNWKDDLIFVELPFKHYSNISQQLQVKENVNSLIKVEGLNDSLVEVTFCGKLPVFAVTQVG